MGIFEDTFFQQLASVCSESRQAFDQHVGMSQLRRQLLALLSEIGEVSHAALQQQLAVDGATITRLVKQFESEGVLSRRLDPQDNRYTLVSLTVSGKLLVAELSAAHSLFQTRLLAGIRRRCCTFCNVCVPAYASSRTKARSKNEQVLKQKESMRKNYSEGDFE